jgi:hypothetical protein
MSGSRTDKNTLAAFETRTPSLPEELCTHFTRTPVDVKRMACLFTGGIPELDPTDDRELERQTCSECEPMASAVEEEDRIAQKIGRSAQTSGSNTPTLPTSEVLGPVIRYKVDKVIVDRLLTDEGTMDEEREVSCLSIFEKRW